MAFITVQDKVVKMGVTMQELYTLLADGKRHSMSEIRKKVWLNAIPETSVRSIMNTLRKLLAEYKTGLIIISDYMPTEENVFAYRMVKSIEPVINDS